jgi:DNA-binding CsgD family transcriptional regulator
MPGHVVGRDAELASIRDFVASISDGAVALVLEGEAGMGKTTLWSAAVEEAEARELLVLRARPSESEATLSFSGVGDLLDRVLEEVLEPLPVGQRRALSRALVLDDDSGPPPDRHAVGVAVLNAVRALAETRPVVLAVDDVQWLDAASSGALVYAARRLESERVGLLLARRTSLESVLVEELRRSLARGRFSEIPVGPLDPAALHRIVQSHLGASLPRPLVAEVHQASDGNPFFALEIVRTLQRSGASVEAGHPLPVPDSLHELVHDRLLALPRECREFLAAAAAHAHPTVTITEAASGVAAADGLTPALEAQVAQLEGDRIRFAHPLFAAGVYEATSPLRRTEIHSSLAELLEDPEARAWQLAASVDRPDEGVSAVLDTAARRARARGAPRPGALLLERACELTPSDQPERAIQRAVEAAFMHFESGDSPRAETQLRALISELSPGRSRALALLRLARIRSYGAVREAADLFLQALDEADEDSLLLAGAHEGFAVCLFWLCESLDLALEHARRAGELALELGDDGLAARALAGQIPGETLLGREGSVASASRALAFKRATAEDRIMDQPSIALAEHWWWTDALEQARSELLELLDRAREMGDESSLPYVLLLLAQVECTRGEFTEALARARESREASEQSGQGMLFAYGLAVEAFVEAQRGDVQMARHEASHALELESDGFVGLVSSAALGHLELALGAPQAAVSFLASRVDFVREERIVEPGALRFVSDHIEALVAIGRREEAEELLSWYEGNARRLERVSALASSLRCRGLLAAQEGDLEGAMHAYREALDWHDRVEIPLDRGRTLLALGMALRRAKRRREARETLEDALGVFEQIGAALWAARGRAELERISGRAPSAGALTPAEKRVAALVAEGRTNREVAAALFLSERTVEGHLSHVFGKLGVRSRTELARVLAGSDQGVAGSNTGGSPVSADRVAP